MKPMAKLLQSLLPAVIAMAMPTGMCGPFPLLAVQLWVAAWARRLPWPIVGNRIYLPPGFTARSREQKSNWSRANGKTCQLAVLNKHED